MWDRLKYIYRSSVDFIDNLFWYYNEPHDSVFTLLVLTVENDKFSFHTCIYSADCLHCKVSLTTLISQPNNRFVYTRFRALNFNLLEANVNPEIFRAILQHSYEKHVGTEKFDIDQLLDLYNFLHKNEFIEIKNGQLEHLKILKDVNFPVNKSTVNKSPVVYLIVKNVQFLCHKSVLAAKSKYFSCLFYGSLNDPSRNVFELEETFLSPENFCKCLEHVYKGQVNLRDLEFDELLDLFKFAHAYALIEFENCVLKQLRTKFVPDRIWEYYFKIKDIPETSLLEFCYTFIDKNGTKFLKSDEFLRLSKTELITMLYPDYFYAAEIDIFLAIRRWIEANHVNDEQEVKELYSLVRFPNMNVGELLQVVPLTEVISIPPFSEVLRTIISTGTKDYNLRHRGYLSPGENVATKSFGSEVILGHETKHDMLCNSSDLNPNEYIGQLLNERIVIKLGKACFINTINMFLSNKDDSEYKYFLEISVDNEQWLRIIDRTNEWCGSMQELKFSTRVARYIGIVGTNLSAKFDPRRLDLLRVVWFNCMYEYVSDDN